MRGSTAGLADGVLNPKISFHAILLECLDYLFAAFVLAPAVIGYWRGTWNLMDDYLFPQNELYSAAASMAIGYVGNCALIFVQSMLERRFKPQRKRLTFYVVSRAYTYVYGAICVSGFRGAWKLLDLQTPMTTTFVCSSLLLAAIALGFGRTIRNISAVPFVCVTDKCEGYFEVPTMFKTSVRTP